MTEGWVDYLTGPWGIAFAFAAGLLSFLSPCVLPLVPVYFAHITGTTAAVEGKGNRRETIGHAITFVLGFTAAFTLIGASVGLIGATFGAGDTVCEVESVKAVAEIYAPVAGEIVAVNTTLEDAAESINSDPYGAWLYKLKVEDGAQRPLGPALAAFLDQLGLDSGALGDAPVENSRGEVVGALRVTG